MPDTNHTIEGTVNSVLIHNPDNGYTVAKVRVTGRRALATLVGSVPVITPGQHIEAAGEWTRHALYGEQFRFSYATLRKPSTREGVEKYLASGMIKNIGPKFAKKLVDKFGDRLFEVIEHYPSQLESIRGLGAERRSELVSAYQEQKHVHEIMTFLHSHGLGCVRAKQIYLKYGNRAVQKLTENPYRLMREIQGIGFKTADDIARSLGIPNEAPVRLGAGVYYILEDKKRRGHCAVNQSVLVADASKLLNINSSYIPPAIAALCDLGHIVAETYPDDTYYFLPNLLEAEKRVAYTIQKFLRSPPTLTLDSPQAALKWVKQYTGSIYSNTQEQAIIQSCTQRISIITGGPGTGKTTITRAILTILKAKKARICCCAPTGRAAKRLSESTGFEATTIHRLLDYNPRTREFGFNKDNPLECDFLAVDELSMITIELIDALLQALPKNGSVLCLGDSDQIPSIGPGAVLKDMINSERIPTSHLTEIYRQGSGSGIIYAAHNINAGQIPMPTLTQSDEFSVYTCDSEQRVQSTALELITGVLPNKYGYDPVKDIQVLTSMHKGLTGTVTMNKLLQESLHGQSREKLISGSSSFSVGDKVLQTVNDHDREVYNGDIGTILSLNAKPRSLVVEFGSRRVIYESGDIGNLQLAYCTSIHKSQGSEYPVVVLLMPMTHYILLERPLLYTAVTRGTERVFVITEAKGTRNAFNIAINTQRNHNRITFLGQRIRNDIN